MNPLKILGGLVGLYRIVPINEAHVRVMFDKQHVFMSRKRAKALDEEELRPVTSEYNPCYWVVPFVTKITKLPLTNIRIDIQDVKLNDKNMAKFMCDIVCFVNIDDPLLAAERTGITGVGKRYEGISSVAEDFRAIMESVMRTVATKQSILEIYMNRDTLDDAITKEVMTVFPGWGLRLVDLEIKDLKDIGDSTIISDIEKKQAAQINADARVKIALETKRAEIAEANNKKDAELVKAETEEAWRKRQIKKDQEVAIAEQEQIKMAAEREALANEQKVSALRKINVGTATVEKEATIQRAEATKKKISLEAEGDASRITVTGNAEADVIKAKKLADAEGTEKLALAQQKFNDAATGIEVIRANKDVGIAYANAQAKAFENAKINVMAGNTQELFSGGLLGKMKVGPKEGVALQQMIENNPEVVKNILSSLGIGKKTNPPETGGKKE